MPDRGIWEPLRHPTFRALWTAAVVSNVGTWMHDTAAAWTMATLAPSPIMVSLMQTATSFPFFLLALPAGALADIVDRRRVLLATQAWMLAAASALAALAAAGAITPGRLLGLTFALGIGAAMNAPAWQATTPELVPRADLAPAVALGGISVNVARAVGPALGGFLVGAAGPGAVFALNAVSFLGVLAVLARWRREREAAKLPPERGFLDGRERTHELALLVEPADAEPAGVFFDERRWRVSLVVGLGQDLLRILRVPSEVLKHRVRTLAYEAGETLEAEALSRETPGQLHS